MINRDYITLGEFRRRMESLKEILEKRGEDWENLLSESCEQTMKRVGAKDCATEDCPSLVASEEVCGFCQRGNGPATDRFVRGEYGE